MKKLLTVVLCGLCTVTFGLCNKPTSREYPSFGRITMIRDDVVTVVDGAGEAWQFTGAEDYSVGDGVSMIMSDNGTPDDVQDDIIISTRYSRM